MPRDRFLQRKKAVLSKLDKSSAGEWDKRIVKLCQKINNLEDFYTTSSCSGRIILMIQQEKKGKDLFLRTWHEKIKFSELKKTLNTLSKTRGIVKFKLEPPILHVACRDMKKATEMLELAKYAGFKRSGLLTWDRNILVELNTSERLEFPMLKRGRILVDDSFLRLIIDISGRKIGKGWEKIQKLEKNIP